MKNVWARREVAATLSCVATAFCILIAGGCALLSSGAPGASAAPGAGASMPQNTEPPPGSPAAIARADGGIPPYTEADVKFMQGMIAHHAQAVTMSAFAPGNNAGSDIQILAARISVSQTDEIVFMQRWLRERKQSVPDPSIPHAMHDNEMHGQMPGMLSEEQMVELSQVTGPGFDKLYLRYMIQHHEGALVMLDKLFGSKGAGQDDDIFKFASDVSADQSTEIARMKRMLAARINN